jgi:hypothetical protein
VDVALEPTVTTRRTGPGSVRFEVSLGRAPQRQIEPGVDPDTVWVGPGQSVTIGGYTIPGGMLYVGERLAAVNEWRGVEPALINPRLPVDSAQPDRVGEGMPY